jgi:hypothetical protein
MEKNEYDDKLPPATAEDTFDHSSDLEKTSLHSVEDSPIEEVRASVPPTDDTTIPTATFRAWFWGIIFSAAISFSNQVKFRFLISAYLPTLLLIETPL